MLPLLLTLVFGIIDFGIIFGQSLALNNAAREAARQGAVPGHSCTDVRTAARASAATMGVTGSSVVVAVSPCPAGEVCRGSAPGQSVAVTLAYEAQWPVPLLVPGLPDTYRVTGHGEFVCEYS